MIYVVTVLPDGTRVPVRPGETVLDASRRYGFSYTVGCREGGCGGCALELEPPWCADLSCWPTKQAGRMEGVAMSVEGMVPSGDAAGRTASAGPGEPTSGRRYPSRRRALARRERTHSGMLTEPKGPQMGAITAGNPHVSIQVATTPSRGLLGHQPWVGFGALLMVGIGFLLLGIAFGVLPSVETLAVPTTFWLPVLLVTAAWWHGWPGRAVSSRGPSARW